MQRLLGHTWPLGFGCGWAAPEAPAPALPRGARPRLRRATPHPRAGGTLILRSSGGPERRTARPGQHNPCTSTGTHMRGSRSPTASRQPRPARCLSSARPPTRLGLWRAAARSWSARPRAAGRESSTTQTRRAGSARRASTPRPPGRYLRRMSGRTRRLWCLSVGRPYCSATSPC